MFSVYEGDYKVCTLLCLGTLKHKVHFVKGSFRFSLGVCQSTTVSGVSPLVDCCLLNLLMILSDWL